MTENASHPAEPAVAAPSASRRDAERKMLAILRVIANGPAPVGARIIADKLKGMGIELSERAVRYHLRIMDERGLTRNFGERGRAITDKGLDELQSGMVSDKLGFVISKIDTLAYRTTFDLKSGRGHIILNASLLPAERFTECLEVMRDVFAAGYCMGDLVAVVQGGESLGELRVPAGDVGFGTVCSVTLNGVLLRHSIPVESRYGGLLEIRDGTPYRFTDLVGYHESTLDPAEIFIASKMTSIHEAATTGNGKVLASFREVPAISLADLERLLADFSRWGFGGVLAVGKPGQPLLGVQVGVDRVGIAVVGGLTPVAAVEEAGIATVNKAMTGLADVADLKSIRDL